MKGPFNRNLTYDECACAYDFEIRFIYDEGSLHGGVTSYINGYRGAADTSKIPPIHIFSKLEIDTHSYTKCIHNVLDVKSIPIHIFISIKHGALSYSRQ